MKKPFLRRFALLAACALNLAVKVQASNLIWTNVNSSVWSAVTNWSPNQMPGAGDNSYITNSGTYTVTLNINVTNTSLTLGGDSGTQTLIIGVPTLTLNGPGVVNANGVLAISGGTLTGTGSVTLAGQFNWTAGTLSITNVTANGGLTLSGGGGKYLQGCTLVNTATANWSGGALFVYNPAVISNAPSGTFNETFAGTMANQAGNPLFANAGQFNVAAGSGGIASISVAFNNSSSVNIQSGTLSLSGGGTAISTGSFTVPSGTTLDFSGGTYNLAVGSSITGAGNFSVDSGTVNENGTFNVGGTNTFNAGTANFLGAYTINGNTVNIPGGTANFMPGGTIAPGVLNITGGILGASNTVSVSGPTTWTGGYIIGNSTVYPTGGLALSGGGGKYLEGCTLVNTATANWSGGALYVYNPAIISNAPSGTFNETFAGTMTAQSAGAQFANAGQFNVAAGSGGIASISVAFNNSSSVNIQSGTLSLSGGGTTTGTGSFADASGATLDFSGGTYNLAVGSSIAGAGNFSVDSGTVNENGTFNVGGTNTFNAGTANFLGAYTINGNTVNIPGGTANFMPGGTIAPGVLNITGGILGASNTVSVSGPTTWTGGYIIGISTVYPTGGLALSGGGGKYLEGCTLVNTATANWSGGVLYVYNPAVISNAPSGTFNETFAGTMSLQSAGAQFANAGQFNVNPGAGNTASIGVPLNNSSSVDIQSGTLSLSGGGTTTSTGSLAVPSGTTLNLAGGTYALVLGSSISGAGLLSVSGATVNENGTCAVTGTNTFSSGTVNIASGATFTPVILNLTGATLGLTNNNVSVSGLTTWTAGVIQGNSILNAAGGLTMSGTGGKYLEGCTLANTATANWSGGTLYVYNPGTISNAPSGTFNETFAGTMSAQSAGAQFVNAGQFNVNPGAGNTASIGVALNNSSSVNIQSGTLSLSGGGTTTSTGSFAVPSGTTLNLAGGTYAPALGSSISGAGLFSVSGATVNENGTCAITGTNTFSSGTVNIASGATFTPVILNLTGATLGLTNNNVSVSGLTTWTAGVIQGNSTLNAAGGLTMSGTGSKYLEGCTLVNTATANWSGGVLYAYNPAVISNAPSGTFNETFAGTMSLQSAGAQFANAGQFNADPGAGGIAAISLPCTNSGTVQVLSGTLNFQAPYDQTAGLTLLNGGNINNASPVQNPLQIQGGTLAGNGTVFGSVTNNGFVSPGMSPGSVTVGNTYVQTTNGGLNIELAGTVPGTSFDLLVVTNIAYLAGTLNATLTNGFYPNTNALFTFLNAGVRSNTFANFYYPSNLVGLQLVYATNSASIQVINVRPVITPVSDQNIPEIVPFTFTVTATDADLPPQTLTWSLISGPAGLTLSSSGVLNWTPAQTQSPSTNTVVVRVTDNGTPPLSVTNSFAIVVYEVNTPPTLPNISAQTVDELTLLTVTNTATESNIHATNAGYFLLSAPAGVNIDNNGIITWTPSQLQSPSTNLITTVVTNTDIYDVSNTHLRTTNTFTVIVREVNVAPVLPGIPTRTVNALATLNVTNTASESNIHATLGYFLLSAPAGATISASGVVSWTPIRSQGPGTNVITTVVTNTDPYDLIRPHLSATNSFTAIVYAPTLAPVGNYTVNVGQTLTFTNSATDNDPSRTLTYSLGAAPAGASITPATGAFSWRAPASRAGTSNYVQVIVTDNSSPPLNDTKSFAIFVNAIGPVVLTPVRYVGGHFTFSVSGSPGPDYIIQASGDLSNWTDIGTNTPAVLPFNFNDPRIASSNQYYRVLLSP